MTTPTFSHRWLAGAFLAVIACAALWSTAQHLPHDAVSLVPCPVRAATGFICPGCGITRASVALARGDVFAAWDLHPFAFLLVPLALAFLIAPKRARSLWLAWPRTARNVATGTALAACLVLWGTRLV